MDNRDFIEIINEIKELADGLKPVAAQYSRLEVVIFTAKLTRIYMLAGEAIKRIKYTDSNDGFVCEIFNFLDRDFNKNKGVKDEH